MDPKRIKLGPRGIPCAFVGYALNSKAYRLLNLEIDVIIESRDVEFDIMVARKSEKKIIRIFQSLEAHQKRHP